jgi:hypothetical protein
MKRIMLAIFGLHLLVASFCIMPAVHAEAGIFNAGIQHISMDTDTSHHCSDCEQDNDQHSSPCAGGHCIAQAAQPASTTFITTLTIGVMPMTNIAVYNIALSNTQEVKGTAPPISPHIQTTVLRL